MNLFCTSGRSCLTGARYETVPPREEMASEQMRGESPSETQSKTCVSWSFVCARIFWATAGSLYEKASEAPRDLTKGKLRSLQVVMTSQPELEGERRRPSQLAAAAQFSEPASRGAMASYLQHCKLDRQAPRRRAAAVDQQRETRPAESG